MKRISGRLSLALTLLTLLGLTHPYPALAQQPTQDLVAFKAALTGPLPSIVTIPVEPPILSVHVSLAGQTNLLGPVTWVDHHYTRLGVDGVPKSTGGIGVMTGANGDALFLTWSAPVRPAATPGAFIGESNFFVTGGRGRFLGATGSGLIAWVFDPEKKEVLTWSVEGMISRPKP